LAKDTICGLSICFGKDYYQEMMSEAKMTDYNPDNWVVIKMNGDDPHYRVLAGWSGSYLNGDSWRMNSGITRVEDAGDRYNFYGSSGSCYSCGKEIVYTLRNEQCSHLVTFTRTYMVTKLK
jgi:hypothetical protein